MITPDQVWSPPGAAPAPQAPPAQESFFFPIAVVIAVSTALMAATLAILLVILWAKG